jgi:hypothetical protein
MARRFLAILTGHNLPQILQPREAEPSTINEKTIADFTRVVEQTGIRERDLRPHTKCTSRKRTNEKPGPEGQADRKYIS